MHVTGPSEAPAIQYPILRVICPRGIVRDIHALSSAAGRHTRSFSHWRRPPPPLISSSSLSPSLPLSLSSIRVSSERGKERRGSPDELIRQAACALVNAIETPSVYFRLMMTPPKDSGCCPTRSWRLIIRSRDISTSAWVLPTRRPGVGVALRTACLHTSRRTWRRRLRSRSRSKYRRRAVRGRIGEREGASSYPPS